MIYRLGDALGPDAAERFGLKVLGLSRAHALGAPVPPCFAISTELFAHHKDHRAAPAALDSWLADGLAYLESLGTLGDPSRPLLLSVRSSSATSMPGILETLLNVGMSDEVAAALDARHGAGVGTDTMRRFLEGWARVVVGMPTERVFRDEPRVAATAAARRRTPEELATRIAWLRGELGADAPPRDPRAQLERAIDGVLRSWDAPRAREYRAAHRVAEAGGTAILIQAMVLGNAGPSSGAGVAYTRNPVTGEAKIFGEFACNAQGDDVVGGRVSPAGLLRVTSGPRQDESMEARCPDAFAALREFTARVEEDAGDAQDIEFTVQEGALQVLQVRTAKRSALAAVRMAVDLVKAGRLDKRAALARLDPAALAAHVTQRLPNPDELVSQGIRPAARGVAASPGAACGAVVFSVEEAVARAAAGVSCVLLRPDCSPEDAPGIRAAAAVVTTSGGLTAHAAVIARALGRPCVVSASPLRVARGQADVRGEVLSTGALVTVDGARGLMYLGVVPSEREPATPALCEAIAWGLELGIPGWDALGPKAS